MLPTKSKWQVDSLHETLFNTRKACLCSGLFSLAGNLCFVESARKAENSEEDGDIEELVSDEEDDWSKDPGDEDEEGEEVNSRKLQKLAAQVW